MMRNGNGNGGRQKLVSIAAGSAFLGVAAFAGGGCGSSGGTSHVAPPPAASSTGGDAAFVSSAVQNTGKARLSLQWPPTASAVAAASRLVPSAANSVKIILLQNNRVIAGTERLLVRPASNRSNLTGTAQWDNLPTGDIVVSAVAYPTTDGSGVALAQASVVATLSGSAEKTVALTLASTIDHLQITTGDLAPATSLAPATMFKGDTLPIAVSAVDKNNAVVLVNNTFTFTSSDPVNAPIASQSGGSATLSGNEATITKITVTETESGKSASVAVPVTGFAIYRIADFVDSHDIINNAGWVLTTFNYQRIGLVKPLYQSITLLSPPPGLSADTVLKPYGLNNKNEIVGSIDGHDTNGNLVYSAFFQNAAGVSTLLPFGSGPNGERRFSEISALNDNGLALISYSDASTGLGHRDAVLDTTSGAVTDLPTKASFNGTEVRVYFPLLTRSILYDSTLTNANQLLGIAILSPSDSTVYRGVVADVGGSIQFIAPLPGDTITDVSGGNALGQVVGTSGVYHFNGGSGGQTNGGGSINTQAAVLSRMSHRSRADGNYGPPSHPFIWTASGGTVALPTLPGFSSGAVYAINRNALILGELYPDTGFESKITLWVNNQPHDLNKMLTGAQTGAVVRGVFYISDTNYITASDAVLPTNEILVPVTRKPGSN